MKCLIYCTKAKPYISYDSYDNTVWEADKEYSLNGKIVAQFDCEKVEEFTTDYRGNKEQNKRIAKDSCVPLGDLVDYQKENHFLYAIYISNLEIFDKPKELSEYCIYTYPTFDKNNILKDAPQNMCRVLTKNGYPYVLISIKPEHIAKILTGKKTIEVRKKVVNKLKELI